MLPYNSRLLIEEICAISFGSSWVCDGFFALTDVCLQNIGSHRLGQFKTPLNSY